MINLFKLHSNPEKLYGYQEAITQVPRLAWELVPPKQKDELKSLWLRDPRYAYDYARYRLKGRWPEAEPVIAQDANLSYSYATYVLKSRFPEGEAAIATDLNWAERYARLVLHDPNPETWAERYKAKHGL